MTICQVLLRTCTQRREFELSFLALTLNSVPGKSGLFSKVEQTDIVTKKIFKFERRFRYRHVVDLNSLLSCSRVGSYKFMSENGDRTCNFCPVWSIVPAVMKGNSYSCNLFTRV